MDYKEKLIQLLNSKELTKEEEERLCKIFPELAESEDERISKEIISYIKNSTVCIDTDTFKKWIAWLEKQGDQKSAWSEEQMRVLALSDHGIIKKESNEVSPGCTLLDRKVVDLPLSVRTVNMLVAGGLETLRDMVRLHKGDYLRFRNFGKKSLDEISDYFKTYNLQFGMDV